jgi:flagellar biosynthesis protein FliR
MLEFLSDDAVRVPLNQAILLAALVAARVLPVVYLVPFMGGKAVPQPVQMGIAIALAMLVYPAVWLSGAAAELPEAHLHIVVLVLKELFVGLMLGLVTSLVFTAILVAGQFIDVSAGITQASSFAPQLPERVSLSGNFLLQFALVIFFVTGGHRIFLTAFVMSFDSIPPQTFLDVGDSLPAIGLGIARLAADSITFGVLLAFPVVSAILLTNIFLALVNKSAPQINVFFLGMPVKAVLSTVVILLGLHVFIDAFLLESGRYFAELARFIEILGGRT